MIGLRPWILTSGVVAVLATTGHAQEVCAPSVHTPIRGTVEQTYDQFRSTLISDGWQPLSVRWQDRGKADEFGNTPAMLKAGFDEVVSCAGTGLAACEFRLTDVYSNILVVVTVGEVWEENPFPGVSRFYFVCED
jgi:hypothetical protein